MSNKKIKEFKNKGYFISKNFLDKDTLFFLQKSLINSLNKCLQKEIFKLIIKKNSCVLSNINLSNLDKENLKEFYLGLFQRNFDIYNFMTSKEIKKICRDFGISDPFINSDPLSMLHINSNKLDEIFGMTNSPWHQDWLSMQGSKNGIVIWIPLFDIKEDTGGIKIIEASHKKGLLPSKNDSWFANVEEGLFEFAKNPYLDPKLNAGDALIFSSFLVHKTSLPRLFNTDSVRLTLQFRISDYECELLRKNNWYFNYKHCFPINKNPPKYHP